MHGKSEILKLQFQALILKINFQQISNQKTYYIKCKVDDVWLHLKVHKDFEEKLTLKDVQEEKTEEEPVRYF